MVWTSIAVHQRSNLCYCSNLHEIVVIVIVCRLLSRTYLKARLVLVHCHKMGVEGRACGVAAARPISGKSPLSIHEGSFFF